MTANQITVLAEEIISSEQDLWPDGLSEADEVSLLKEMIRLKRERLQKDPSNN